VISGELAKDSLWSAPGTMPIRPGHGILLFYNVALAAAMHWIATHAADS
jgi:hypothetical protein